MLAPMKLTPAERKAKLAESIAKHPLLHKRLVPQTAKRDSLVRLNRNIEAGIKTKQAPSLPILRANDEKAKTLWVMCFLIIAGVLRLQNTVCTHSAPKLPLR